MDEQSLYAIAPFPKNCLVEIGNYCNHQCIFCKNPDQERESVTLSIEIFEKFIREAKELGLEEVGLYSTGEPFATKNLEDYISAAKKHGIQRIYLTTNGSLATLKRVQSCVAAGLDSIKFSINAGNREDYKIVHGKDDFDKVLNNVKEIYEWKTKSNQSLQMIGSCVSIQKLPNIRLEHNEIFSKYFEDIAYVDASSQGGQALELPLTVKEQSAVFRDTLPRTTFSPCQMLWNRIHLSAEGYLSACCVDYNLDLVYADLKASTLSDSWNNNIMKGLRTRHLEKNLENVLCDQCMRNEKRPFNPITPVELKRKKEAVIQRQRTVLVQRIKSL